MLGVEEYGWLVAEGLVEATNAGTQEGPIDQEDEDDKKR